MALPLAGIKGLHCEHAVNGKHISVHCRSVTSSASEQHLSDRGVLMRELNPCAQKQSTNDVIK